MSDELRKRLAKLDPMHLGVPVDKTTYESSRHIMEDIMNTETKASPRTSPRTGGRWLAVAAVATLIVGVAGAIGLKSGSEGPGVAVSTLELNAGGDAFQSCLQFSVEELAKAEIAFEGVVISSDGSTVELEVSKWFKGGDATNVLLNAPAGFEALIAGIPFQEGETYLITAYGQDVNYCGFSGISTPEFRAAFESAFGA